MFVELRELNCIPNNRQERESLCLPLLDTEEIISHMPEGKWIIPQEPYTFLERIDENDLDFIKSYKREFFQRNCREIIAKWVLYLDKAEKGRQIIERVIDEGMLTPDLQGIGAFNFFHNALKTKLIENEETDTQDTINSCRNAFLYLLTTEEAEKLGHNKPESLTEKEIDNARFLVDSFVKTY